MLAILWFRKDLRLTDNPALLSLAQHYTHFLPLYIWDETVPSSAQIGAAQKWWLHHSLGSLNHDLEKKYNVSLLLLKGKPQSLLEQVIKKSKASALFWNRGYDPHSLKQDQEVEEHFQNQITVENFNGSLLFEPSTILNKSGKPFQVFTPFYKTCLNLLKPDAPSPSPKNLKGSASTIKGDSLSSWNLLPTKPNWAKGFEPLWEPGEQGAQKKLKIFLKEKLSHYATKRDFPAEDKTSGLSPHLHFGEISPQQVWHEVEQSSSPQQNIAKFQSELGWREFSYYLLYHFPSLPTQNFNPTFNKFQWEAQPTFLKAWQKGLTGYPLVDAGMRQLWATGWMHNRVRMIVASFLTKHLLIDWRKGAAWFADTLLDADLANNSQGWQWVSGSGADAAPYFRIFNPVLQSQKFDPTGEYIRQWVPELKNLNNKEIHTPWQCSPIVLSKAGIVLGETYPAPIVDHEEARKKALKAYQKLTRSLPD